MFTPKYKSISPLCCYQTAPFAPISHNIDSSNSSNSNSHIKQTRNICGKSHIEQTSYFDLDDQNYQQVPIIYEQPSQIQVKYASPTLHPNVTKKVKHFDRVVQKVPRTQQKVLRVPKHMPVANICDSFNLNNKKIEEKLNYFISEHNQMSQEIQRMKQKIGKENQVCKNNNQNRLLQTLNYFQSENQELKKQFHNSKQEAERVIGGYQQKLEEHNRIIQELQSKQYENYVPRSLVQQLLFIHQSTLQEQQTLRSDYKQLVGVLKQVDMRSKQEKQLASRNIEQLIEDLEIYKQQIRGIETQKNKALEVKVEIQNLYFEKKKDFQILKNLKQPHKADNSHYEKRIQQLEKVSKERQTKIVDLRENNRILSKKLQEFQISLPKNPSPTNELLQLQDRYYELEKNYQKEVSNRLNIEGKMSLILIENEKLKNELYNYRKEHYGHKNSNHPETDFQTQIKDNRNPQINQQDSSNSTEKTEKWSESHSQKQIL